MTESAHKMIAKLCISFAYDAYQTNAMNNAWYKMHPDPYAYVAAVAPTLRPYARQILAEQCGRPDISDSEKQEMLEAIIFDKTIPDQAGVLPASVLS